MFCFLKLNKQISEISKISEIFQRYNPIEIMRPNEANTLQSCGALNRRPHHPPPLLLPKLGEEGKSGRQSMFMKIIERICAYALQDISALILSVILMGFYLTGCSSLKNKEDALALPTLEPTPHYLLNLVPTGVISQQDYEESRTSNFWIFRGIAVGIFTTRMGVSENNGEWEIIKDRAKLFIDGEQVSNDSLVGGADGEKGGGLFRLSWAPTLTPGTHEAKFQFTTDEGDKLEYSWQFTIKK